MTRKTTAESYAAEQADRLERALGPLDTWLDAPFVHAAYVTPMPAPESWRRQHISWQWQCNCGQRGPLLPTPSDAHAAAVAHVQTHEHRTDEVPVYGAGK